jgi:hypothetical protein
MAIAIERKQMILINKIRIDEKEFSKAIRSK